MTEIDLTKDAVDLLSRAFAAGLTQSDMLTAAHKHFGGADEALIDAALVLHCNHSDNTIEVDDNALTSEGEDGTWVAAWLLVKPETDEEE